MTDRVRPLKIETKATGSQNDMYPTALNPNQDLLDAHGIAIQNTSSADEQVKLTRDASGNLTMVDPVSGQFRLSDLRYAAPSTGYLEITRANGSVSAITLWSDATKVRKLKETAITRAGGAVSSVAEKEYKADGSLNFQITYTITRTNGAVSSIAVSRS